MEEVTDTCRHWFVLEAQGSLNHQASCKHCGTTRQFEGFDGATGTAWDLQTRRLVMARKSKR